MFACSEAHPQSVFFLVRLYASTEAQEHGEKVLREVLCASTEAERSSGDEQTEIEIAWNGFLPAALGLT
jgi:hypothetical protein